MKVKERLWFWDITKGRHVLLVCLDLSLYARLEELVLEKTIAGKTI